MLYYEELFTRSQCCNCRQEISGLGIECAECHGGNFRICSECFAVGCEIGQHTKEHRYRFFDSGSLALFPASASEIASTKENNGSSSNPRWSAREEIRLLDAIEQYGFGNWQDISRHIESRGSSDAKKDFVDRFVTGNIGQLSWSDRNNNNNGDSDSEFEFKRNIGLFPQPIDHTVPCDDGPLSPSLTQRLPPLDISSDEMLQLGYMPFRDDYEKEYDNDAEKLVAQLNFTPEDDEVDIALKLALVDMYSRRLRERSRRKRVIRDYQLVCKFFKKDRAKALTTNVDNIPLKRFQVYEKNLQEKLRPYAQFYNSKEFDHMIRNIVKEKDFKLRLQELYKYRSNGITRPEECIEFERLRTGPGFRGKRNAATMLDIVDEEDGTFDEDRSHRKAMTPSPAPPTLIQQLQQPSLMQESPRISLLLSGEGSVNNGVYVGQNLIQQQYSREDYSLRSSMESNVSELALLPQLLEGGMEIQAPLSQGLLEENSFQQSERQRVSEGQYTANYIPSADQLTEDELSLCLKTNILPAQFLTIKLAHILGRLNPDCINSDLGDENVMQCPPEINIREWEHVLRFFYFKDINQSSIHLS